MYKQQKPAKPVSNHAQELSRYVGTYIFYSGDETKQNIQKFIAFA